jgi:neurotransmitter:Na+ symporter, NSS family
MRQRWTSKTVFLFAAIGSAVGLGNVWRFPYLTYKYGGGAFLLPYLIALLVLGMPLLILEFGLGQKFQKGVVGVYGKIHKRLEGVGVATAFVSFVVMTYYAVIISWTLLYFFKSFTFDLPWKENANTYFFTQVLHSTDLAQGLGTINWPVLVSLAAVWFMIYYCVRNGVKSIGEVIMYIMPLSLILLIILFVRGITLPGAAIGMLNYIKPDFMALLNAEVWLAAASQVFFSFSLCFGVMIAYASFNKKDADITQESSIIAVSDAFISLFAGFIVFSIIGYMATMTGISFDQAVVSGPGLAFVVFPQALSLMPFSWFFSLTFFLALFFLGMGSAISSIEAVNVAIQDKFTWSHKKVSLTICILTFAMGIVFTTSGGMHLLEIVDHYATSFGLVTIGLLECFAVGWMYNIGKMRKYINKVSNFDIGKSWEYIIKYVIPVILVLLLVTQMVTEFTKGFNGYPPWALYIGWTVGLLPLVIAAWFAWMEK